MSERKSKSVAAAYSLWFFLGFFGGHRHYLGRHASATTMMVVTFFGVTTLMIGTGQYLLTAVVAWTLIDAMLIPEWVARMSRDGTNGQRSGQLSSSGAARSEAISQRSTFIEHSHAR